MRFRDELIEIGDKPNGITGNKNVPGRAPASRDGAAPDLLKSH